MPALSEALNNTNVVNSIVQAWGNTRQNNVEWGGWIYYIPQSNSYATKLKTDGQATSIVLTKPNDLGWFSSRNYPVIADFHCHPGNDVSAGKPSKPDIDGAKGLTYARLVFTPDTNHLYGQDVYGRALPRPTPDGFPDGAIMWHIH
jgi:hypothetical protein